MILRELLYLNDNLKSNKCYCKRNFPNYINHTIFFPNDITYAYLKFVWWHRQRENERQTKPITSILFNRITSDAIMNTKRSHNIYLGMLWTKWFNIIFLPCTKNRSPYKLPSAVAIGRRYFKPYSHTINVISTIIYHCPLVLFFFAPHVINCVPFRILNTYLVPTICVNGTEIGVPVGAKETQHKGSQP